MSDVLIDQDTMEDIGDSIRSKLGVQTTYLPSEMPGAIMSISGGGGGGSAKYTETVLWENSSGSSFKPSNPVTITLSDRISNYKMLAFIFSDYSDPTYKHTSITPVSCIEKNGNFFNSTVLGGNAYNAPSCAWISDTSIKLYGYSSNYPMVCYKVIGIKWETMQTALIYSEEEREVGVWTDGKPLYQKTINCGLVANDTSAHNIAHNISNIEKCISCNALLIKNDEEHFANAYRPTQTIGILVWRSGSNIRYVNNWLAANEYRLYATLQYTKTTDTPGSGIWTTIGEYAVHYDGTERVIGTWFGETLYERSYDLTLPSAFDASGGFLIDNDVSYIKTLVSAEGSGKSPEGYITNMGGLAGPQVWQYNVHRNPSNQLVLYSGQSSSAIAGGKAAITIRYTKTTS